jgi:hypothetical protein
VGIKRWEMRSVVKKDGKKRTLENMWVIGLVTLMLKSPAMQSKNPKNPVIKEPQQKIVPSHVPPRIIPFSRSISPRRITAGRRKTAEPTFVHHAS